MWKDIAIFGIPGYCALAISALLYWQDRRRYHVKLRFIVSHWDVVWYKDNQSLVLFRMIFVNHSLRGQIVATTSIKPPSDITCKTFPYHYGESFSEAVFPFPDEERGVCVPAEEMLVDVLDIPPQQSRHVWNGILLNWGSREPTLKDLPFPVWFYAHDINAEELARCRIAMTLSELKNPKIYEPLRYVRVEK